MIFPPRWLWLPVLWLIAPLGPVALSADHIKVLQAAAIKNKQAEWGHWGVDPKIYSNWKSHSNRLIPVYTFGITLDEYTRQKSAYRDAEKLEEIYGFLPKNTCNPQADYCDQTDIYRLQQAAVAAGKKYIFLFIFDGLDWQTTQAAAIAHRGAVEYTEGRGTGFYFQDYRAPVNDFGCMVTSPHNDGTKVDVNGQVVINAGGLTPGGYDWSVAGSFPWERASEPPYLISQSKTRKQAYTDSSSSATSLCAGIKTYNDAINVDYQGRHVATIARQLQEQGMAIGVVTSVPISHATPACAYANNVQRDDFQDLTRDLLGLPSIAHRHEPLPGVDVLLGAGWGEATKTDKEELEQVKLQGINFVPGNKYLTEAELQQVDAAHGGRYRVVQRTPGKSGKDILAEAAREAEQSGHRLLGMFGVKGGHLPFRTADGEYDPTEGVKPAEKYTRADLKENPTLADLTEAALTVLSTKPNGFWLMVEPGDVDWANHDNNIDNSAGAVKSGDDAFRTIIQWIETRDAWRDSAVIVTADHGHLLTLTRPEALAPPKATK